MGPRGRRTDMARSNDRDSRAAYTTNNSEEDKTYIWPQNKNDNICKQQSSHDMT